MDGIITTKASIGIMENNMETTIVYWGYIGTMEKQDGNYYPNIL